MRPEPGQIWRHYKGSYYKILAVAKLEHSPESEVVVYQALEAPFNVWVRPLADWFLRPSTEEHPGFMRFEQTGYRIL